ncbi:hypothetical protein KJ641_00685 [Patescibacteria group bacterium]|nr:hypothetical protein [Patescibacteria group bacterium]MBU1895375.1 hypothetical protein [Patescibacteria group bacterium]
MKLIKIKNPFWCGIIHAILIVLYVVSVAVTILFLSGINEPMLGIFFFLILLVFSVSICGYLIFFEPARLMVAGKAKEAGKMLIATLSTLFIFVLIFLLGILIISH